MKSIFICFRYQTYSLHVFVTCVKEAYTKLADLCHKRGWHLFYIRPKLHMVSEEGFLGYDACIYFIQKLGIHMYLGSEAEASDGT